MTVLPKKCSALLLVLLAAFTLMHAQERSVVMVHAEGGSSGYGVAHGGPGKVVTALHIVSGRSKISVKWEGKTTTAVVEKVYKPADLALLRLQTDLGIPQADVLPGAPPLGTPVTYWENAVGSTRMSGKTTSLSRTTQLGKIDPRLAADPQGFAMALCKDGSASFPALTTNVLKFGEKNIEKSHSGSPLTANNRIIGLVNGGDKPVNGSVCVWAIPAAEFKNLMTLGTPPPGALQPCTSGKLYGGLRSDNPFLTPAERQKALALEAAQAKAEALRDQAGNDVSLTIDHRTTFADVFETLFEEEQKYIEDMFVDNESEYDEADQVDVEDLFNTEIDFYREEKTGATIAVPVGSVLVIETQGNNTIIAVNSPDYGMAMHTYVYNGTSINEAIEAREEFRRYLVSDGLDWQDDGSDEWEIDNYLSDPEAPYYNEVITKVVLDEEENVTAEFFANVTISYDDCMGVMVQVNDWSTIENDATERKMYYLLEVCSLLTDFPYY